MTLSRTQITDLNSNEPDGVYLFLLDVDKVNSSSGAIENIGHYINDSQNHEIQGTTYQASPFTIALPSSGEAERGLRDLIIPIYDPSFVNTIRDAIPGAVSQQRLEFTLKMVSNNDFTTAIGGVFTMSCQGVSFNEEAVVFSIGFDTLFDIAFPINSFTKGDYPALF